MTKTKKLTIAFTVLVVFLCILKIRYQVAATGVTGHHNPAGVEDIDKTYLLGQFSPASTRGFVQARMPHASRDGLYLLSEVYDAFVRMHDAARADGIALVIVSATRKFEDQKRIWQGKWTGQRLVGGRNLAQTVTDPVERARVILEYSSMPGTSRHHWGTDIDINSVNVTYFDSGIGLKTYAWLAHHAARFGFVQTYTPRGKDRPYGYEEEPWHWSYQPVAGSYTRQYAEKVSYDDITGFAGSETASKVDVITHYVLGINRECFE